MVVVVGMFDTVRCRYPLPHHQDAEFQTKDLASVALGEHGLGGLMDEYEITKGGRLRRHVHKRRWVKDPERTFFGGYLKSVRDWWEDVPDVHGDVCFYTHDGEFGEPGFRWIEFRVRFTNGRVQDVREVKSRERAVAKHSRAAARTRKAPRVSAQKEGKNSLRALLSGGDRRSIARSKKVSVVVRSSPERVPELAALTSDEDWLVGMRAIDLLEKLAHEHPEWIEPHKHVFIGPLADSDKWEVRLQVVRALPLFDWTPPQRRRVREILLRDVEHPQTFLKAWALDSLATFAQKDAALMRVVRRQLRQFERSRSKALAARARQIRQRLASTR